MEGTEMRKPKSGSDELRKLRRALVRDGMTTYPLAMQAIAEFQHEVFSILERVVRARAKAISQLVGNAATKRHSHRVEEFLDGAETWLSVVIKGPCSFQIGVDWKGVDKTPAPVRISACLYFDKRSTFQRVDKALQDRFGDKFTTDDNDWGCYLEKAIQQQQIDRLESELGKITDMWIKMLRTANVRKVMRSKQ
jgi:hypothetical protein